MAPVEAVQVSTFWAIRGVATRPVGADGVETVTVIETVVVEVGATPSSSLAVRVTVIGALALV